MKNKKFIKCNWCGKKEEKKNMHLWNGVYFCSDKCLDECRTIQ